MKPLKELTKLVGGISLAAGLLTLFFIPLMGIFFLTVAALVGVLSVLWTRNETY